MNTRSDHNDDIANYVLGQMDSANRARFEERLTREPELLRAVTALQTHFQALDDTVSAEPVPVGLWGRIDSALGQQQVLTAANTNTKPGVFGVPRWAGMAASVALALGVGFFSGQSLQTPQQGQAPLVVAVLLSDDMAPGAIIEAFDDDSIRIIPLEALIAPPNSTLEMWTLPDAETGPVSLGTFQEARELILGGPDLPAPQPDQLYEITVEPEGGSPTGRPTGPILLKGFARAPVV
ncbi:anti-sigma factor [Pelagibacterium luteolum]|uniref:Anti-sigma-K factor RskA n=1 Tax=Pelagibacterium luteolum TaxID=440168 RepID=A0A1G7WC13_9HYPH|nr:anti-sigma factor [Pelagibacterium luteolum]SDG69498.1 Anti-sigma-K factor RskA [Pelagibacterium luteolum]